MLLKTNAPHYANSQIQIAMHNRIQVEFLYNGSIQDHEQFKIKKREIEREEKQI